MANIRSLAFDIRNGIHEALNYIRTPHLLWVEGAKLEAGSLNFKPFNSWTTDR